MNGSDIGPGIAEPSGPRIWVLHTTGLGANRQLLNLAERVGGQVEVKHVLDSPAKALWERLYRPARRKIPERKSGLRGPPWPDLVLFGGGRSVVDALRIRHGSGGYTRLVCIGRPAAPLDWFDCVITTPQYGLPAHPRVVQLALPLNRFDGADDTDEVIQWRHRFERYPKPWIGVLLGGNSGSYRFGLDFARRLGRILDARARSSGGTLLITTSPRTPPAAVDVLQDELRGGHFVYRWDRAAEQNPLTAILALAEEFVVTADSASMLAEACSTGRPVASVAPPLRLSARLMGRDWLSRRLGRVRQRALEVRGRMVIAGRWVPARDMHRIHLTARSAGLVHELDDNADRTGPGTEGTGHDGEMERAAAAVRKLL